MRRQGTGPRDTLHLPAGYVGWFAIAELFHLDQRRHFLDGFIDFAFRFAQAFQAKRNDLMHCHIRK